MKNKFKQVFLCMLLSSSAFAQGTIENQVAIGSDTAKTLAYQDVVKILRANTNLSPSQTESVIRRATEKFGKDSNGNLNIQSVMTTSGFNYFLFMDHKHWDVAATFKVETTGDLVTVNYDVEYFNGGVKVGVDYEFTVIFIPSNMDVRQLHGSTFGRGLMLSLKDFIAIPLLALTPSVKEALAENPLQNATAAVNLVYPWVGAVDMCAGWIPGDLGSLFAVTGSIGLAAATLTFPKMIFRLKHRSNRPMVLSSELN